MIVRRQMQGVLVFGVCEMSRLKVASSKVHDSRVGAQSSGEVEGKAVTVARRIDKTNLGRVTRSRLQHLG
jgi:hypothetical protein